jgi:hypothetical protein
MNDILVLLPSWFFPSLDGHFVPDFLKIHPIEATLIEFTDGQGRGNNR